MKIGVDVDDVLANFAEHLLNYNNRIYHTSLTLKDIRSYNLEETLNVGKKEVVRRLNGFFNEGYADEVDIVKGAVEGINKLKYGNELYALTARPECVSIQTNAWLRKNFNGTFKDVIFTRKRFFEGQIIGKHVRCKELGLNIMVEDNLDYAKACAEIGTKVLLFDQPWNQCSSDLEREKKLNRVFYWEEIPPLLKNMSIPIM